MQDKKGYLYTEKISSIKTSLLFIALMIIFLCLSLWLTNTFTDWNTLDVIVLCLACFFLFYVINFRTLTILINPVFLQLKFGIFKWKVSTDNIKKVQLDEIPFFMKYGGVGIHFMFVRKRYRASFNFLEYPRICLSLKKKRGWVEDISFSTRKPEKVMRVLTEVMKKLKKIV